MGIGVVIARGGYPDPHAELHVSTYSGCNSGHPG